MLWYKISHIIFIFISRRQKKQTRFLWSPRPKWRIVLCFEYLESGWKYSHVTYLEPISHFWNCGHFDVSLECWRLCGNPPSVWHFKGTPIWKQGKRFFLQKRHLGRDMIYFESNYISHFLLALVIYRQCYIDCYIDRAKQAEIILPVLPTLLYQCSSQCNIDDRWPALIRRFYFM